MKRMIPALLIAVVALTACGEDEPTAEERRQAACDSFASLTPGVLETQHDVETLADPGASTADKSAALKRQAQWKATGGRDYPYDCDRPSDEQLFEEHYGTFDEE
ncbi:hypothetical protein [Rhodococcus rhodochrous]|uniref:hypothetical protein n=1 Tax=Rhodococcus rhodochrous TaxID=1829 RepID=UPI001E412D4B|nr:hypothetical protein [Rhodococcus rhodochrous]MCD2096533.1 hypothetical protein [Rhodococcus rhodochrous]MCD2121249.1 hypothetical protein [Rhodococcus rhodochrous]MCQ4137343.1 hypothetical protein [Rhodococcus rhodochrous]MDJ0021164.1 hypothetical protein [Rhodococcus rhodochrous]